MNSAVEISERRNKNLTEPISDEAKVFKMENKKTVSLDKLDFQTGDVDQLPKLISLIVFKQMGDNKWQPFGLEYTNAGPNEELSKSL